MRTYLLQLRKSNGMTQKDVAEKLGISESYYNLIENGNRQRDINVSILNRLSKIFNSPIKKIMGDEKNWRDNNDR